ncbi:MAG: histidine kinase dimerization/phospho-acceptor domain-containing protein, partial [Acidobacteriota bacterium]
QNGLWGQGISGDLPILLLRIRDSEDLDVARQVLLAHEYFSLKQLAVDLVIINEHAASYAQDLQIALEALVRMQPRIPQVPGAAAKGAVFLLRVDLVPAATAALLASAARVVLSAERGSLSEQLRVRSGPLSRPAPHGQNPKTAGSPGTAIPHVPSLEFFNGYGGFAQDGRDYVVVLRPGQATPAPWINVVANPGFGFLVAAEGGGYTWSRNSRENQLTPWSNDPVTNRSGEAFYIRDADTKDVWCPTAFPRRDAGATYVATHGRGFSRFERVTYGIASSLLQYVPVDDPVKLSRLQLHNLSGRARRLTVSAYVEWVLGASRTATSAFVATEMDAETGAMFARNPWGTDTAARVAFADLDGKQTGWMSSIVDVSEQKQAEENMRTQQERLQNVARLTTMGEIASSMAHELNQPLAAITSYVTGTLNMMHDGGASSAEIRATLEKANLQAQRAGQVIRRVHDYVRKREPQRVSLSIHELVQDCLPLVELQARRTGVRVTTSVSPDLPRVMGDPVLLEQVLLNLTRNAIEAMATADREHRRLEISAHEDTGDTLRIDVRDYGAGIAAELR